MHMAKKKSGKHTCYNKYKLYAEDFEIAFDENDEFDWILGLVTIYLD